MGVAFRKCLGCKKFRIPRTAPHWEKFCEPQCKADWALREYEKKGLKAILAKADKKERQETNKKKRENADNNYSYQLKLTKRVAQQLANLLDAKLSCICCDTPRRGQQFCGGHFKTGKAHPELAVDLRNIHGQANKNCNEGKSGNIEGDKYSKGYKQGIIDRYGRKLLNFLERKHPAKQFTPQILKKIRAMYAAEIRLINKTGEPSRDWRDTSYDLVSLALAYKPA